jgi:delta(3,5)-delta(2,4)-dienoyl-CoA isomerase
MLWRSSAITERQFLTGVWGLHTFHRRDDSRTLCIPYFTFHHMDTSQPLACRPHPLSKDFEFLTLSISIKYPHVTIVVLNRPRKRNAINAPMWKEIGQVFNILGRGDACRSILLMAQGNVFCAGIDVTDPTFWPSTEDNNDVAHVGLAFLPKLQQMQACFTAIESCPVPVVAAMHGACIGAGLDLICCADVRLCSPETNFSVREVKLGLTADVGVLQRLPKLASNQSLVSELCLTARDFDANCALNLGLVSRISDAVLADGLTLCGQISQHSPVAVQGTKRALLFARDHTVAQGLEQVGMYNMLALQGDDLMTAWKASKQQRPDFADIPMSKL